MVQQSIPALNCSTCPPDPHREGSNGVSAQDFLWELVWTMTRKCTSRFVHAAPFTGLQRLYDTIQEKTDVLFAVFIVQFWISDLDHSTGNDKCGHADRFRHMCVCQEKTGSRIFGCR